MKEIVILGSSGSIGRNTLEVIRRNKSKFRIKALCVNSNIELLEKQIIEFNPKIVAVFNEHKASILQKKLPFVKVVSKMEGLIEVACYPCDFLMAAISGCMGIVPTMKALEVQKTIGLANKEVLVSAGEMVTYLAKKNNVKLIPVDSEHNAIFQCLKNEDTSKVSKLIITASGGPFRERDDLQNVTVEDALKHPTYAMGKKISIDSATLMNKGLEIIEAYYLFSMDKIDVVIHPQSLVHSFVEFIDGSLLAQINEPDMQIPIQYSLFYPKREIYSKRFDFMKNSKFEFFPPDLKKFPCLRLAREALKIKKSMPCFMNAANEELVMRFLNKEISFLDISYKLEKLMSSHKPENMLNLNDVLEVDKKAKRLAKNI